VLRRLKKDVAQGPAAEDRAGDRRAAGRLAAGLYKQILEQVRKSVLSEVESKGIGKAHIQILAALTRLRQVACDPRLMKLEAGLRRRRQRQARRAPRDPERGRRQRTTACWCSASSCRCCTLIRKALDATA
jgi:SNF2 family DNA or RNA helicase